MLQDLPDRPWLRDERDQPNIAAARWALQRLHRPSGRAVVTLAGQEDHYLGHYRSSEAKQA